MKKKIIIILIVAVIFPLKANASVIVMDADSNRVLYGSNEYDKKLIASTSKIMTSLVVLNNANIEDIVTITPSVLRSFGSGIYIEVGEKISVENLLYGLMLRSGNDAALAIASHVAGSKDSFVFIMNEMAHNIGMKNSSFVNPSGLEENDGSANMSTAYDMAILMRYAMQNKDFRRITSTKEIMVKSSMKTYKWLNKNKLLRTYEYCTGGKTGFTEKARRTLVTSAEKDGMSLVIVTFNDGNDFSDHKELYEKYFNGYERIKVLDKTSDYGEYYKLRNDFYLVKKDDDKIETNVIKNSTSGAIDGSIVGKVEVILNGEVIGSRNLYYEKVSVTKDKSFLSKLVDFLKFW